jgi:hypothetical protein
MTVAKYRNGPELPRQSQAGAGSFTPKKTDTKAKYQRGREGPIVLQKSANERSAP